MDARDTPPRSAPSLAGALLSLLSLSKASSSHPRAFFVVQSNASHLHTLQGVHMSTSAECPTTPSRGAGASNAAAQKLVNSTPQHPPASQRIRDAHGNPSSAAHADFIQHEYKHYMTRGVGVFAFIKAVFNFDWDDIPPKPHGKHDEYKLSSSDVKEILEASKEVDTYDTITKVSNELLSQIYGYAGPSPDPRRAKARRKKIIKERAARLHNGREAPVRTFRGYVGTRGGQGISDHPLEEKPDMTYGVEMTHKPDFKWMTVPIEVERTKKKPVVGELSDVLMKQENGVFKVLPNPGIPKGGTPAKEAQARQPIAEKKVVRSCEPPAVASRPSKGASSQPETQTIFGASGSSSHAPKRKLQATSEEWEASTESSSKRPKTSQPAKQVIINKEAQLLKYINQVMSHNIRSYAIGWLIQNDKLRLVYGDRMGVIFTEQIEFLRKDAHLFLLILAAMGAAGVHQFGIHPNVHYPKEDENDPVECREVFDAQHGYDGAVLRLEGQGQDGSETLEYDFDVDEKAHRSVYTEFGLIGRGTTVIPIRARKARTEPSTYEEEQEELVAKVAWPHAVRVGEDVFINKVRTGLERNGKTKMLQHIVDMKAALTKDAEAMDLPRHAMGSCPKAQDLRVCRILILKRYRPLDTIGSQAEFHQVFVQVVRAHHWAYTTSHVLHRDISMNNIMWFKRDNEVVGVLCDWDLAEDHSNGDCRAADIGLSDVAAPPDKEQSKTTSQRQSQHIAIKPSNPQNIERTAATSEVQVQPRHRTGTGPFMAVDLLLSNPPPPHKYRHDLESFLYIYISAAVTFDPRRKQKIRAYEAWNSHDLRSIGALKARFLSDMAEYEETLQHAHADFKPMVDGPLDELYRLFCRVEFLSYQARMMRINRHVGGENMDDLQRQRDAVATYKNFMDILKEPENHD